MNNNVYLKLENVKKSFANFELDNVSFSLPKGYIMAVSYTHLTLPTT